MPKGQSVSEYALPIALIGILAIGILAPMGGTISSMFSSGITHKYLLAALLTLPEPVPLRRRHQIPVRDSLWSIASLPT